MFSKTVFQENIGNYLFMFLILGQIVNFLMYIKMIKNIFAHYIFSSKLKHIKDKYCIQSNNDYRFNKDRDNLSFQNAIAYDKRKFGELFKLRVKQFHPIFSVFCSTDKNRIKNVLIGMMLFGIECDFALNAFFYSDDYISNSAEQGGSYDLIYSLTKISYSFLIGILLSYGCNIFAAHLEDGDEIDFNSESQTMKKFIRYQSIKKLLFAFFFLRLVYYFGIL